MSVSALRRTDDARSRVTTLELFYDLVFVFAITQVSHVLLADLSWEGAGRAAVLLLVVHWSWNFTTWATNELDPERGSVRGLLLALMLASLLMALAIPEAFGDRGLLFAAAYVAIQLGRHGFLTFVAADAGTAERDRAGRILAWFAAAGVLWIAGGLADGATRTALWVAALVVDLGGPLALYRVPWRSSTSGDAWDVGAGHMAERFGLFVIIALGETIVLTGATTSESALDLATVVGFALAFAGTAALWWLYFSSVGRHAEEALEHAADRTTVARDVYTYLHALLIAGIVVSAVGDELVIAHPTHELHGAQLVAVVAGPALYLAGQALIRWRVTGHGSPSRAAGIVGCVVAGAVGTATPALVPAALVVAVLVALVVHDTRSATARA